jgi:hypothetical protein
MNAMQTRSRSWGPIVIVASVLSLAATWVSVARAQDCNALLGLLQQGRSNVEIARQTGLTSNDVAFCRTQLQRPIVVGPDGAPPVGAAGSAPINAAGPPPVGAAGPPPVGAAGPPPVGRAIKRLP